MFAIVHLSDIHFDSERSNHVSGRAPMIASAIAAVARDARALAFVVTGDVAYRGNAREFAIAEAFFAALENELLTSQRLNVPMYWIGIPGNHDCDHTIANQLRRTAISREATGSAPDAATLELATGVMRHYHDFASRRFIPGELVHPLVEVVSINDGRQKRVLFQCVNAAWCSTDPEHYGDLWLPQGALQAVRRRECDLSIGVVHYPLNWLDLDTRRRLKRNIDTSCQLVLTGHEHYPDAERIITADGFQCEHIAGGYLQQHDAPGKSSFEVLLINLKTMSLAQYTYSWTPDAGRYEFGSLVRQAQLMRRRESMADGALECTDEFESFLDDLGMPISHPNPRARALGDFFIWPDVAVWIGRLGDNQQITSSRHFLEPSGKSLLVCGSERSGKTSFGKRLFVHWRGKGASVLWMDAGRVTRELSSSVDTALKTAIEEQFGSGATELFLQIPPERKAIIIDDFHLMPPEADREAILRALRVRFGKIVLLVSNDWISEHTASTDSFPELFSFQMVRLVPCGPKLRHELVEKWVRQIPSLRHDPREVERRVEQLAALVDGLLGHDLVVPYPSILLAMLQSLSAHGRGEINHGSLGHTYHTLIYTRLAEDATPALVNMRLRFLTDLAWELFEGGGQPLSHEGMAAWHTAHIAKFNLGPQGTELLKELRRCGLLDDRGGEWHFRHKYVYFYFVAEHVNQYLHQPNIQEVLRGLVLRLHHEDASNVFSFVAFKSRNDAVLQMLVDRAASLFAELGECDLGQDCAELDAVARDVPRLVIEQEKREPIRQSMLAERDGEERKDEHAYSPKARDATREESDEYGNMLLTSIRLITVLGQVVRNHAGQLEASKMEWLVETTYSLAMRTLSSFLLAAGNARERLVKDVVTALRERSPGVSLGDLQLQVSQKVIFMIELAVYGLIRHSASSVGLGELMGRTLEVVRARSDNITVDLIDTSIELDRARVYPRKRVIGLGARLRDNPFALGVFRIICWMNFHLYRVPDQDRQAVCENLDIKLLSGQVLSPRGKLPVVRVSERPRFKVRKKQSRGS